jgi:hypothetical protein
MDGLGDPLVHGVGEPGAILPGPAVLPLPVVVGTQELGVEVSVAVLEVDPVRAAVMGEPGCRDELLDGLLDVRLVDYLSAKAGKRLHADPLGEAGVAQLPGVGELPHEQRLGVDLAHLRHQLGQRFLVSRHHRELELPTPRLVLDRDGLKVDEARAALEQVAVAPVGPVGRIAFLVGIAALHCIDDESVGRGQAPDLDGLENRVVRVHEANSFRATRATHAWIVA